MSNIRKLQTFQKKKAEGRCRNFRRPLSFLDRMGGVLFLVVLCSSPFVYGGEGGEMGKDRDARLRLYEKAIFGRPLFIRSEVEEKSEGKKGRGRGRRSRRTSFRFEDLAYSTGDLDFITPREVSFYVPNDGVIIAPPSSRGIWKRGNWKEDDRGILRNIKKTVHKWESDEQFVEHWRIEHTSLYRPPSLNEKKSYLEKNMLRYADKLLGKEIKDANKGSTLHQVGQAKESLRPQTRVSLGKNYRLRFRGKVLRGLAFMKFENPHIKQVQLEYKLFNKVTFWKRESQVGEAKLVFGHRFQKSGPYSSHLELGLNKDIWKWRLRRDLREVMPGLAVQWRTEKDSTREILEERETDQIGEVLYGLTF